MRPVRFSQHHGIQRDAADDWFDPLLTEDTALSVDPFLIFLDDTGEWSNAHETLMSFFVAVIELLKDSRFNEQDPRYQKALSLLLFKEPPEFCLGTSKGSIFGAGANKGLQVGMLDGAREAIRLGLDNLKHFEELALFGEQLGADRISDITCDVLKPEFVEYTHRVAHRHGIPLAEVNVGTCGCDENLLVWRPGLVELPLNPIASSIKGRPVGTILVPKRFLRQLPNLEPQDFWNFAASEEAKQLRGNLNVEIGRKVHAAEAAKLARQNRALWQAYLAKREADPKPPYDVETDPELIVKSPDFGKPIADLLAAEPVPASEDQFVSFIEKIVDNFRHAVEQFAWRNLWVGDRVRRESHAQVLFQTSAAPVCELKGVDLSPEANAGAGPVDFKMSIGWERKVLIEVKYAKSSSFWRNLKNQLPRLR